MYDDILGNKKKKEKKESVSSILLIGTCGQCAIAKTSKVHRRSSNLYCPEIKKYIHAQQAGCLKFKQKDNEIYI